MLLVYRFALRNMFLLSFLSASSGFLSYTPSVWAAENTINVENTSNTVSLAVLPFENLTRQSSDEWMGLSFAESLAGSLARVPSLQVIERSQIKRVLQEQHFSQSALVESAQAPSLGKLVGARRMVLGNFQKVGERLRIQARMISVETGQIIPESVIMIEGAAADILDLQDTLAQKLLKTFQFSAPVQTKPQTHQATATEVHSLYYRGLYLLEKNTTADRHEAEKLFQEALRLAPQDALVQTGLAELSLQRGITSKSPQEFEKALHWINSALTLDPRLLSAWLTKVNILSAQDQSKQAEALLKEALQVFPGNTELVLSYVNLLDIEYSKTHNATITYASLKALLERLGADFNAPEIVLSLGTHLLYDLYNQSKPDYTEVFTLLQRARQALPDNPIIPLHLSDIYLHQKDPDMALKQVETGLALDPDSSWIPILAHSKLNMIELYYKREKQPERATALQKRAIELMQAMIRKQPEKASYHVSLAGDLDRAGDTDAALAELNQAQKLNPEYPNIYTQRARIFQNQKKWSEALVVLDQGLAAIDKSDLYRSIKPYLMLDKANLKIMQGQSEEGAALFQEIYDKYPAERSSVLPALIGYYESTDEYARLLGFYQEYFQLEPAAQNEEYYQSEYKRIWLHNELLKTPDSAALLNDLGQIYSHSGQSELAQTYLQKALAIAPENPVVLYNLGSLYLGQENPTQALPLLEKALKNKPAYVNAAYNLGLTYLALQEKGKAKQVFTQILQWQPNHTEARAALKGL
jgi:tetratricopeptide (TPR) repeat protein